MATTSSYIPVDVRPLTEADKAAVAATAPVLAEHGVTITKEMYKVSFEWEVEACIDHHGTNRIDDGNPRLASPVHI